jgi:hypothetical protein
VDDLRRGIAEDAVAQAEVQGRADDDDEVGALEGGRPRTRHEVRVARRDDAAAHAVGDDREVARRHEFAGGLDRIAHPDPAAEDDDRSHRGVEQGPCLGDRLRVGLASGVDDDRRHLLAGGGGEDDVHRDVPEHRAAVRRRGEGERTVAVGADLRGVVRRPGVLRHGREDRRLIELLQGARAPA